MYLKAHGSGLTDIPPNLLKRIRKFNPDVIIDNNHFFLENPKSVKFTKAAMGFDYVENMLPVVCCSCDERTFKNESRKIKCDSIPPIMLKVLRAPTNENLPEKLSNYYNAANYIFGKDLKRIYNNIMLSPRGIYTPTDKENENKKKFNEQYLILCDKCSGSLHAQISKPKKKRIPPKWAIRNHHWIGYIDDEIFNELPWITKKLLCRAHNIGMVEAHKGKIMNMYGTRHTFLLNPEEVYTKFPHAPKDLKIKVVLTGHFSKPEIQKILKPYLTTRRYIEQLKQQFDIWGNEYWIGKNLDREQLSHYDDVQKQIDVILVTSGFNEKDKKKLKKLEL